MVPSSPAVVTALTLGQSSLTKDSLRRCFLRTAQSISVQVPSSQGERVAGLGSASSARPTPSLSCRLPSP